MADINHSRAQKFILFTLGRIYTEFSRQFNDKPLQAFISKASFIELATKAHITTRTERTLYRQLEILEKKKIVSYENKNLALTLKGKKMFEKIEHDLSPYLNVAEIIKANDMRKFTKKVQTVLSVR